jgi:tRNA(fMet)-specific endonuclease VapC
VAVLIDTDLLIDGERGRAVDDQVAPDEERAISVVTVSELLHGVHRASGATRTRRRAAVEQVIARFEPIAITEPVARVHAEVWADVAGRGEAVGAHDLWIAATAIAHGLDLVTRNAAEFRRVAGLRIRAVPG